MALQDYARLATAMKGNVLVQLTSIQATWNSGQNRIDLLNEGLAGFTPGSGDVTIDVGFVIPIGGLEENYTEILVTGEYVAMQVFIGGLDYTGYGKLMTCQISQSTNEAAAGTFQWMGQSKPLQ